MAEVQIHVTFSPSQLMALRTLIAEYLRTAGHTEVFVDALRRVETTPEGLLARLLEIPA